MKLPGNKLLFIGSDVVFCAGGQQILGDARGNRPTQLDDIQCIETWCKTRKGKAKTFKMTSFSKDASIRGVCGLDEVIVILFLVVCQELIICIYFVLVIVFYTTWVVSGFWMQVFPELSCAVPAVGSKGSFK